MLISYNSCSKVKWRFSRCEPAMTIFHRSSFFNAQQNDGALPGCGVWSPRWRGSESGFSRGGGGWAVRRGRWTSSSHPLLSSSSRFLAVRRVPPCLSSNMRDCAAAQTNTGSLAARLHWLMASEVTHTRASFRQRSLGISGESAWQIVSSTVRN